MYTQFVYENSAGEPPRILVILNQYISEILAKPAELHSEDSDESLDFSTGSNQEVVLQSFEVRKAMLQAERRKAEALDMLRLKETLR